MTFRGSARSSPLLFRSNSAAPKDGAGAVLAAILHFEQSQGIKAHHASRHRSADLSVRPVLQVHSQPGKLKKRCQPPRRALRVHCKMHTSCSLRVRQIRYLTDPKKRTARALRVHSIVQTANFC